MSSRRARERRRREKVAFMEKLYTTETKNEKNLDAMTKAELIGYAEENGIEIDKSAKKADVLARIKEKE